MVRHGGFLLFSRMLDIEISIQINLTDLNSDIITLEFRIATAAQNACGRGCDIIFDNYSVKVL